MARRTTADIVDLIEEVNRRNRLSTCDAKIREGWNSLLEHVLQKADMYAGFGHINETQMKQNGHNINKNLPAQLPGVIMNYEDGSKNPFPDDTRRFYYFHRKLPHAKSAV